MYETNINKSISIDDAILSEISIKYPTLTFELAMPDTVFDDTWQSMPCVELPMAPVEISSNSDQPSLISLVANADFGKFNVGTKVTLGNLSMVVSLHPDTYEPIANISLNYKI